MSDPFDPLLGILLAGQGTAISNYIVPGLNSYLFSNKVRWFHATREQEHFVVPHSHRYDFAAYVVQGAVLNTRYVEAQSDDPKSEVYEISEYDSNTGTRRLGSNGRADAGTLGRARFRKVRKYHAAGSWYSMRYDEYHTIWFKKGSVVLVLEGQQYAGYSRILEPFVAGKHLRTFHRELWMQTKEDADE